MRGGWRCCEPASQKRDTGHPESGWGKVEVWVG
jgi:hypothetical protein